LQNEYKICDTENNKATTCSWFGQEEEMEDKDSVLADGECQIMASTTAHPMVIGRTMVAATITHFVGNKNFNIKKEKNHE
jgi:hypothetical protein